MRRLTGIVIAIATSTIGSQGVTSAQAPAFRGGVDLVNLGVTVTDRKGRFVADLSADDFEIVEDGKTQTVRFFGTSTSSAADLHLGLLLDVSGSMESDLAFMKTASIKFLNTLTEAVDVTVVDFDTEVRVARYPQTEFARLIERIRLQKPRGDTALFDAIGVYLNGAADQDGRKVMLLYTDGGDTRSAMRLHELLELVKASDVTIYVIGVLDHRSMTVRSEQQLVMRQIAELTGGQVFFPASVKLLDVVYDQVVSEIRAQYSIGYLSANAATDGKWRKVEIRVKAGDTKGLKVRSRRGYFAPRRP